MLSLVRLMTAMSESDVVLSFFFWFIVVPVLYFYGINRRMYSIVTVDL